MDRKENLPVSKVEPFYSEKKFARSNNKVNGKIVSYNKGAPEVILKHCNKMIKNGKVI